ncbi:roadblock/LC7 domain-containing protein [bacterium]|nr:roadblock/LC7 domain-containing protein [bacterium]
MDFKTILNDLLGNVDGAIGAGLVGTDGIVIEQVSLKGSFNISDVGAEYATIVKNAKKASESFGLGKTSEILISTEKAMMIMNTLSSAYFVAIALELDGNLGRGRLEVKKALPKLEKELT